MRTVPAILAAFLVMAGALTAPRPAPAADADYIAKMRLVNRYLAQGVPDAAVQILEQLLDKYPEDARVASTYAEVLIDTDQLTEAGAFLEEALTRVPDKVDLYRSRVRLRRAQNRPQDAFSDVLLVLQTKPDLAPWTFRETQELLDDGLDSKEARKTVDAIRKDAPDDLNVAILASVVTASRGKEEDALRIVLDYDGDHKQGGRSVERFAQEMLALGRENLALEGFLAAVDRTEKPERRSPILFQVADILERQGKYQEALGSLERVATERDGTAAAGNARLRSAEIYQAHLNDPEGALAVYEKIQNDPVLGHYRPNMLLMMADCYVRLGKLEQAAGKYREVIPEAFDPEDAELAQLKLAEMEFFRGHPDSALAMYQTMAEENPRSLFADQAADRYILLNKYAMMDPLSLEMFGRLEWAREIGDSARVEAEARTLFEAGAPEEISVEALLALSEMYEQGGNHTGALGRLAELVEKYPDARKAPEALMREGRILHEELDRSQEALMRYETVLTDYPSSVQAGDARRLVEALRRELKS